MSTVRFVLRTDKIDKNEFSPIELIYQLSGQRKYFGTKEKLHALNWQVKNQQAIYLDKKTAAKLLPHINYNLLPSSKEVSTINDTISTYKKEIADIEKRFELNKIIYSAQNVIDTLKGNRKPNTKTEAPANELFNFIDKYIKDHKETREQGSLAIYKTLKNHLESFQRDKKIKVTFDNIDYNFFLSFQNYLITPRDILTPSKISDEVKKIKTIKLNNSTVAKHLSTIKTFLNYAKLQGITINESFRDFKIKREELEVIALTNEEFEKLYKFDLSKNNKLAQVRDVFCFACTTGLRFSDILQLKREHIKSDFIRLTVTKTKQQLSIPLTPYSQALLAKYSEMHKPLPVISNQKTNDYIHELCKLAEINDPIEIVRFQGAKRETTLYNKYELISVHTGRKTFCTLSLEKGMNAEEVMKITGHKDYRSFKRYVNITEKRTKVVMQKAWGEIPQVKI